MWEDPIYRNYMAKINIGKHWYTNGVNNRLTYECPEGYWEGKTHHVR